MDKARHTTIIADCWKGYNHDVLTTEGFNHLTFNHSLNFVDPDTGTHTNTIEITWRHVKSRFPQHNRCRNCGGGDRGRVAIYRPFGELRRAKIVLSPVWCSRPTTGVPLAHATMNFVGLDLTASDSAPGTSEKDDGFTFVGRNGRRIAPIVIDSQSNATELLDQLGKFCDTPLEGRFENGKLRVFPASAEEHRLIQKYISDKKLRSHTFEMAHNKQLKVVLRGLPTDFNQEELMSELHSFGFQPNHIFLLRNRKTNTNMPLFLVTLVVVPGDLTLRTRIIMTHKRTSSHFYK
ncbi:nucleic-acid-binding protein from transposon X-element [Trichonephila clavipes]|nr:nucleic-acid-binding protein from transposon X-element [Trichonephila clavipes]